MAMCSSTEGWDEYLLLYHFNPEVKLDQDTSFRHTVASSSPVFGYSHY